MNYELFEGKCTTVPKNDVESDQGIQELTFADLSFVAGGIGIATTIGSVSHGVGAGKAEFASFSKPPQP